MSSPASNQLPSQQELTDRFNQACTLHEKGFFVEALEEYRSLLTLVPNSSLLHFNCALALFDLQQFTEAGRHYQKAAEIAPEAPDIHYNQGLNFRRLGKIHDGIKAFTLARKHGDNSVDTLYTLALCYQDLHEIKEAADLYEQILSKQSNHQPTLNNYAYLCHKSGERKKAETLYRRLLQHNPDHQAAQHMIHSLSGETPESAPLQYVEAVFDNYAETFENSLVGQLHYKTPQVLWDRYCRLFHEKPREHCLDLGCGTGLAGQQFAPCCTHMTGVDISEEMLTVAKEKNLYAQLKKDDIAHFLLSTPQCYDLIIAADVFTYIGNLSQIFTACYKKTAAKGVFLFSVEESQSEHFELKTTGRFGHSIQYIQNLCNQTGWSILDSQFSKLRHEQGKWITGFLFILQK